MKKIFLISAVLLVVPVVAFAQGFVPLAPIPGLTQGATADTAGLATFFNNLYKYLIGLAAVLAVIEIIWGGLEISTKDSVSKQSDGKERITQAIFGLVLVLSPVLVFSIINPSILNLSLNLPELKTTGAPAGTGSGPGTGTAVTDPATQCSVSGVSGILQIVTCPSEATANAWGQQNCSATNLNLSAITPLTIAAGGGTATNIRTCTGNKDYVFIETIGVLSKTGTINRIQPLAVTADNPNNGNNAIQFKDICREANVGRATCVSNVPSPISSVNCPPELKSTVLASSGGSGKCYEETLSCVVSAFSAYCDPNPSWTPFQ